MQNLIKIYTKTHISSIFSRWRAWPLVCVQLISLFLYENSHFSFRMLSNYTLKRINYKMFSKKISESYSQPYSKRIATIIIFYPKYINFYRFFKTKSDKKIYIKTHENSTILSKFSLVTYATVLYTISLFLYENNHFVFNFLF